jgi:uncharacterized protein YqgC (DUF456 family)
MNDSTITLLVGSLMGLGVLGVVVPIVPDVALIWLGALGYGLFVGWGRWGPFLFAGITLLGILGGLTELWGSGLGARRAGGSIWAIFAGIALGLIALVLLGPIGAVIGLLLGTFSVELLRYRDPRQALRSAVGMGVGLGISFFIKLALALTMIGLWLLWVLGG